MNERAVGSRGRVSALPIPNDRNVAAAASQKGRNRPFIWQRNMICHSVGRRLRPARRRRSFRSLGVLISSHSAHCGEATKRRERQGEQH